MTAADRSRNGASRLVGLEQPVEWEASLAGLPHAFGHTWASCFAMSLTTAAPTHLYVWETGRGRAVLPFVIRSFCGAQDILTPYGFGGFVGEGDCSGLAEDWRTYATDQGYVAGFIGLNPLLGLSSPFPAEERFTYNQVYQLDLGKSEEDLYAALTENRKRQVQAYRRGELVLIRDGGRCAEFLLEHVHAFFAERGASPVYQLSRATIEAIIALPNVLLVGAGSGADVQAVCVLAYTQPVAEYFLALSVPAGRRFSAALVWESTRILREQGVRWFNLGGGVAAGDGIAQFKERFGADVRPLRCLKQVYDEEKYRALCVAAGCDPKVRDGYFPPYHRPAGALQASMTTSHGGQPP